MRRRHWQYGSSKDKVQRRARLDAFFLGPVFPKGPCAQLVYTLAPKYPHRDYFKAKVYTIWAHGPL